MRLLPEQLESVITKPGRIVEQQLIYCGTIDALDENGNPISWDYTSDDIEQTLNTFHKTGNKCPVMIEHSESPMSKIGDVIAIDRRPDNKGRDSLYVTIKYADFLHDLDIESIKTCGISPAIRPYYPPKPELKNYLKHVGVTPNPAIYDMESATLLASANGVEKQTEERMESKTIAFLSEYFGMSPESVEGDFAAFDEALVERLKAFMENYREMDKNADGGMDKAIKDEDRIERETNASSDCDYDKDDNEDDEKKEREGFQASATRIARLEGAVAANRISTACAARITKLHCGKNPTPQHEFENALRLVDGVVMNASSVPSNHVYELQKKEESKTPHTDYLRKKLYKKEV